MSAFLLPSASAIAFPTAVSKTTAPLPAEHSATSLKNMVSSCVIIFKGCPKDENVLPYIEWQCAAAITSGRAAWS